MFWLKCFSFHLSAKFYFSIVNQMLSVWDSSVALLETSLQSYFHVKYLYIKFAWKAKLVMAAKLMEYILADKYSL